MTWGDQEEMALLWIEERRREDKQKLKVEEKKQAGSEWGKGEKIS